MGIFDKVLGGIIKTAPSIIDIFSTREDRKLLEGQADLLAAQSAAIAGLRTDPIRQGQPTGNFGGIIGGRPGFQSAGGLQNIGAPFGGVPSGSLVPAVQNVLPGGSVQMANVPGFLDRFTAGLTGEMSIPTVPSKMTACGPRAARELIFVNPNTGQPVFYKNMGRPLLFSGDLTACKRVNKIARRAKRSTPRTTTTARRRTRR